MWSKINAPLDRFLNGITMYRLVLYVLIVFLAIASILGFFHLVPYSPISILLSTLFITLICLIANEIFAKVFLAPVNVESVYITALILALIVSPIGQMSDLIFLTWVSLLAMASKYILAVKNKHLFNPAAIAVVLTSLGWGQSASWWVGNAWMALPVAIGGYLIVRKIRREDMVANFLLTVISFSIGFGILKHTTPLATLNTVFLHSSLLFFAGVMLTEPLTSPTTKRWQSYFGIILGFLFLPQIHFGSFYFTPEMALIFGNLLAYFVSSKDKLVLSLQERILTAPDTYDFIFPLSSPLKYQPGQYMEWTLSHPQSDSRGNRRYFTLASSPTENNLRLGVKFYSPASSYKKYLLSNTPAPIVASQIAGDFVLPKDTTQKIVFMAGGIGITPFRSMLKYLIDTKQKRDIVLVFANRTADEIVYKDVFDAAEKELGIKTIYTLTAPDQVPSGWSGHLGRVDAQLIAQEIPDYQERLFYLSGPRGMVTADEDLLAQMGVKTSMIKTDFFPGFA